MSELKLPLDQHFASFSFLCARMAAAVSDAESVLSSLSSEAEEQQPEEPKQPDDDEEDEEDEQQLEEELADEESEEDEDEEAEPSLMMDRRMAAGRTFQRRGAGRRKGEDFTAAASTGLLEMLKMLKMLSRRPLFAGSPSQTAAQLRRRFRPLRFDFGQ